MILLMPWPGPSDLPLRSGPADPGPQGPGPTLGQSTFYTFQVVFVSLLLLILSLSFLSVDSLHYF